MERAKFPQMVVVTTTLNTADNIPSSLGLQKSILLDQSPYVLHI
jgi:hypothetical protein